MVNNGTIRADAPKAIGSGISILTNLTNAVSGVIQVTDPAALLTISSPTWINQGAVLVSAGTLTVTGSWGSTGTISLTGGTVNLGGSFITANIGTVTRTGGTAGTVNVTGTLTNTGATLALDTANNGPGSWNLVGGTIVGGTVTTANGALLVGTSGFLDGITLGGTFQIPVSGVVSVKDGMTLASGTIQMLTHATLTFQATVAGTTSQSLLGTGTITMTGSGGGNESLITQATIGSADNQTVTFAPGISLHATGSAIIGNRSTAPYKTWMLSGPISAETATGILSTQFGNFFNPVGNTWIAQTGGTLNVGDDWTNNGTITAVAGTLNFSGNGNNAASITPTSNSTVSFAGVWGGSGSITTTNSTLNLGGSFISSLVSGITRIGGTVNLTGTETGDLTLNNSTGSWNFLGGTISNGTFSVAAGSTASLIATGTQSFLNNVTLASPIDLSTNNGAKVQVTNNLTLNTSQLVGSSTVTNAATFTFSGINTVQTTTSGEFVMGLSVSDLIAQAAVTDTLTIASGVLIRGGSGRLSSGSSAGRRPPPLPPQAQLAKLLGLA